MGELPKNPLDLIMAFIPADPAAALEKALPKICYAEVAAVAQPTAAQVKLLREMEPYDRCGIAEIRAQLVAGKIRLGPFHRSFARGTLRRKLRSAGLEAADRPLTREELIAAKFLGDGEPDYFKTKP